MALIVLYDACVLYPAPLRDLLMRLAMASLFQARWTDKIHDEWTRNVSANRPDISPRSLARCRELMNEHVPDSLVEGFEHFIPGLELPDPDDRHVLAAAIHGGAKLIVTFNLRDFPASALEGHSIEAIHPDEFLSNLWDESPEELLAVLSRQRAGLRRPPHSAKELLDTLERCGLTTSVARIRAFADRI